MSYVCLHSVRRPHTNDEPAVCYVVPGVPGDRVPRGPVRHDGRHVTHGDGRRATHTSSGRERRLARHTILVYIRKGQHYTYRFLVPAIWLRRKNEQNGIEWT